MRWFGRRPGATATARTDWLPDERWAALFDAYPFLGCLDDDARSRLRDLAGRFLDTKAISGAQGLVVDDAIVAGIVVQACLPILELGLAAYPRFDEIVVHPGDFLIEREIVDEDGVVHAWSESAAGESWSDGPLVLSWAAAGSPRSLRRPPPAAFNVVIHEFAHKLDAGNGAVDGTPAFSRTLHPRLDARGWRRTLEEALDDFAARVDDVERAIPRHVDPDSMRAERYYATLPLDAYAATDEGEFFSVSSEAFFVAPEPLAAAYPDWYAALADYYRQDPLRGSSPRRS